jgi:hypothetical protein
MPAPRSLAGNLSRSSAGARDGGSSGAERVGRGAVGLRSVTRELDWGGGEVRAWAKGQGIAGSGRGRIPASVIEQYQAAKGS